MGGLGLGFFLLFIVLTKFVSHTTVLIDFDLSPVSSTWKRKIRDICCNVNFKVYHKF